METAETGGVRGEFAHAEQHATQAGQRMFERWPGGGLGCGG